MGAKLILSDGRETVFDIVAQAGNGRFIVTFNGVPYYADYASGSGQAFFDLGSPNEKRVPSSEMLPADGVVKIDGGPQRVILTIGGQALEGRISSPGRGTVQIDGLRPASLGGLGVSLGALALGIGVLYFAFFRSNR